MENIPIQLQPLQEADLDKLFEIQLDEAGCHMAAFVAKDSSAKATYLQKWQRFLADPTINTQVILHSDVIIGSVGKYVMFGDAEITYWIDRAFWGKGIATAALHQFIPMIKERPLFGRAAFDNVGSQKVLQKCGFVKVGEDKGFANARNAEIVEYIYELR